MKLSRIDTLKEYYMNNTILPITDAIIGYLQKERLNNDKKEDE